jgi:ABC-type transport system involved in multi-copper enzyme maturation permease subunit
MKGVFTVLQYTFLEGVRARFFQGILFVALFLALLGSFLASVPYGKVDQIMARIGWGGIFLFAFLFSTFYTIQHITRERDQRVLHLLLAKPIFRWEYALGKFLGLVSLMGVGVFGAGFLFFLTLFLWGQESHTFLEYLVPAFAIFMKSSVLLAYALLFSTLFSAFSAFLLTTAVYLMGVGSMDLYLLAEKKGKVFLKGVAILFQYLSPQLSYLDFEGWTIYKVSFPPSFYIESFAYLSGYLLVVLSFYLLSFQGKELVD